MPTRVRVSVCLFLACMSDGLFFSHVRARVGARVGAYGQARAGVSAYGRSVGGRSVGAGRRGRGPRRTHRGARVHGRTHTRTHTHTRMHTHTHAHARAWAWAWAWDFRAVFGLFYGLFIGPSRLFFLGCKLPKSLTNKKKA
jgi:ABC-type nickel/cobalt efflux system permease component RcnA